MGKTIISQARGHGSFTYRVRRRAYIYRIKYPSLGAVGVGKVLKLVNSPAHSCPLAKIMIGKEIFYNPAAQGLIEGQEIQICGDKIQTGNIVRLGNLPVNTTVFNLEITPGDGGKITRCGGGYATIIKKDSNYVILLMASKKEIILNKDNRATIGIIAGQGRKLKPLLKAGKKHHMMKARNKLWPRTSAIKVNAVDHPFGSGRGKRIKSKIAKRNAPPGAKVGHLSPRRTGHIR